MPTTGLGDDVAEVRSSLHSVSDLVLFNEFLLEISNLRAVLEEAGMLRSGDSGHIFLPLISLRTLF